MTEAKPSKSAAKRADKELKALGEALIALAPGERERLPLDERLRDAIDTASGIRAHGALRRQRQLVGKLLRNTDIDAIRRAFAEVTRESVEEKRRFRTAETWRDRLLSDDRAALDECVANTGADRNALHQALGQVARAHGDKADKTARRALFRLIHDALERGARQSARQQEGTHG